MDKERIVLGAGLKLVGPFPSTLVVTCPSIPAELTEDDRARVQSAIRYPVELAEVDGRAVLIATVPEGTRAV